MVNHWRFKRKKSYVEGKLEDVPFDGKIKIPHRALDGLIGDEDSVVLSLESLGWRRYASIVPESRFKDYERKCADRIVSTLPYSLPVVDGCIDISELSKERFIGKPYTVLYVLDSVEVWHPEEYKEYINRNLEEAFASVASLGL